MSIVHESASAQMAALMAPGYDRIRRGTALLLTRWGHGPESSCRLDLTRGALLLRRRNRADVLLPAQSLGVYTRHDAGFRWSWDEPLPRHATEVAHRLRSYGRRHHLPALEGDLRCCRQDLAWDIAAIAVHLSHAWSAFEVAETIDRFRYLLIGYPVEADTPRRLPEPVWRPTTLAA
jgi:hypothetical protein